MFKTQKYVSLNFSNHASMSKSGTLCVQCKAWSGWDVKIMYMYKINYIKLPTPNQKKALALTV